MTDDVVAEMQMTMVRVCRDQRNVHGVWSEMQRLFPDYSLDQIKSAVRPVIIRMMDSL